MTWILFYLRESGIDIGNRNREEELRRKAKVERFQAQLEAQQREKERRKDDVCTAFLTMDLTCKLCNEENCTFRC